MPRITDKELNRLKQEISLVDLVLSHGVELKPQGDNLIGLCPFHNDTNPSLVITPKKNLWNCLGACGEGGSVIDWVMKSQNLDFKQAVQSLKTGNQNPSTQIPTPEITFDQVCDYYHKKLYDHKKALDYLKQRGFDQPELYSRFKIGFVDQSLSKKLSPEQITALKNRGLIRRNGQEHFINCLTVPLLDGNNQTVGFYGRCINPKSLIKHLYLKDQHQGIFNRKASRVFDQIILTESIIDALSLIRLGLENVQALYGVNGLTEEHLQQLKEDRVKQITLALDNDTAGQKTTEKLLTTLGEEGFTVKTAFPGLKDWNEMLTQKNKPLESIKQEIQALFKQTDPQSLETTNLEQEQKSPSASSFSRLFTKIEKDRLGVIFTTPDTRYRVTGIKELFVSSLKVGIKAEQIELDQESNEKEIYYDSLDLYSAKSRSAYSRNLSRIFASEPKRIEKDLVGILEVLESERDKTLELNQDNKRKKSLRPEEVKLGMSFLKNPGLFEELDKDLDLLGYVGEERNKRLLYLAASSRLMESPISVIIQSESASGKSLLVESVIKLLPREEVMAVTSLSEQALNYADDLNHKFLSLGEAVHSEVVEYQIREMLSNQKLSRLVTFKDEKTGSLISKPVVTEAKVATAITATGFKINPENASRCFVLNIDESKEQTQRIHHSQRDKYSLNRYLQKQEQIPRMIQKHKAAQRLLKKRVIFNPYAKALDFPAHLIRTRRDHDRFMDLMAVICFLRQYQKPVQRQQHTEYIECDLTDYKIAYEIMVQGVLTSSLSEIPQGARELYRAFKELAKKAAKQKKLQPYEIGLTQREIREATGFNQSWVKRHLRVLVEFEYVVRLRGGQVRTKGFYRLVKNEELEGVNLSMIPTPDQIKRLIKKPGSAQYPN